MMDSRHSLTPINLGHVCFFSFFNSFILFTFSIVFPTNVHVFFIASGHYTRKDKMAPNFVCWLVWTLKNGACLERECEMQKNPIKCRCKNIQYLTRYSRCKKVNKRFYCYLKLEVATKLKLFTISILEDSNKRAFSHSLKA